MVQPIASITSATAHNETLTDMKRQGRLDLLGSMSLMLVRTAIAAHVRVTIKSNRAITSIRVEGGATVTSNAYTKTATGAKPGQMGQKDPNKSKYFFILAIVRHGLRADKALRKVKAPQMRGPEIT
jgi:hypothetical protein